MPGFLLEKVTLPCFPNRLGGYLAMIPINRMICIITIVNIMGYSVAILPIPMRQVWDSSRWKMKKMDCMIEREGLGMLVSRMWM